MTNIKRLSLALVALGLSAPAFAADCRSSTVLVPSQHGGFKVGIDALYLRANGSDLGYATTVSLPNGFPLGLENNDRLIRVMTGVFTRKWVIYSPAQVTI